jgi:hypothetical protein
MKLDEMPEAWEVWSAVSTEGFVAFSFTQKRPRRAAGPCGWGIPGEGTQILLVARGTTTRPRLFRMVPILSAWT